MTKVNPIVPWKVLRTKRKVTFIDEIMQHFSLNAKLWSYFLNRNALHKIIIQSFTICSVKNFNSMMNGKSTSGYQKLIILKHHSLFVEVIYQWNKRPIVNTYQILLSSFSWFEYRSYIKTHNEMIFMACIFTTNKNVFTLKPYAIFIHTTQASPVTYHIICCFII